VLVHSSLTWAYARSKALSPPAAEFGNQVVPSDEIAEDVRFQNRRIEMRDRFLTAFVLTLLLSSPAGAQVVSGVMTVTGAEMH